MCAADAHRNLDSKLSHFFTEWNQHDVNKNSAEVELIIIKTTEIMKNLLELGVMGIGFRYNRPWKPLLGQAPAWLSWLKLSGHLVFGARRQIHLSRGPQETSARDIAGGSQFVWSFSGTKLITLKVSSGRL